MSRSDPMEIQASQLFPRISPFYESLFEEGKPLWSALDRIAPFLKGLELGLHKGKISDKAHLENPEWITIAEGAVIEPFAYIKGPCWIGKGAEIRQGAYIRGNVVVGEGAVIGHTTEVKNSVLFPHVHAAHFAYIGDSILGEGAHLGAAVILANLRLDGKEICVAKVATGRRKMGAIIGEEVEIGCNSVINPGSIFFPKSRVFPQLNWGGLLQSGEEVVGERPSKRAMKIKEL